MSILLLLQKVRLKAKFYFSNKYFTWIKTKWKNHSSVKTGTVGNTWLLPHAKMPVQMSFFSEGEIMLWRRTFCRLFHTERSWHPYWFSTVIVSGRHDLLFDARAFPLTCFEMQWSSLRLNKFLGCLILSKVPPGSQHSDFRLVRECDGFLRCFITR